MHTSFDIEQKGEMPTQEIALFQIKRLFQAIENSDYDTIKTLVDIKYLAKVYAFVILTGNMHPLDGDNLRYIYDFSTGTFKTTYRLENRVHKMEYSNGVLKNTRKNNLLLEKLATQKWFRDIAYNYLKQISNDEANILKILSDEYQIIGTWDEPKEISTPRSERFGKMIDQEILKPSSEFLNIK